MRTDHEPSASVAQRANGPPHCHVSMTASGTGAPAPSNTAPVSVSASGSSAATGVAHPGSARARWRNGPTVCDGVSAPGASGRSAIAGLLERRRGGATQDDVEAEAQCPLRLGDVVVVAGDEAPAGGRVGHGVEDRVLEEQRVVREV